MYKISLQQIMKNLTKIVTKECNTVSLKKFRNASAYLMCRLRFKSQYLEILRTAEVGGHWLQRNLKYFINFFSIILVGKCLDSARGTRALSIVKKKVPSLSFFFVLYTLHKKCPHLFTYGTNVTERSYLY